MHSIQTLLPYMWDLSYMRILSNEFKGKMVFRERNDPKSSFNAFMQTYIPYLPTYEMSNLLICSYDQICLGAFGNQVVLNNAWMPFCTHTHIPYVRTFRISHMLLPPYYANAHLCLSKICIFHYKWSYKGKYVDASQQNSYRWNDPKINIKWPIRKPILSKRDKEAETI